LRASEVTLAGHIISPWIWLSIGASGP
jgi:hypothetical protein